MNKKILFSNTALIATALILSAHIASACAISTARIVAEVVGSDTVNNTCVVDVIIKEIASGGMCQLRSIKVGQEISVKVLHQSSLPDGCPQDEGFVLNGEITSSQGEFTLISGTVQ